MGIDWFACNYCGDTFPDCGDWFICDECGTDWCSEECAKADGAMRHEEDGYGEIVSCKYCRNEDLKDSQLVAYLLSYFNVTREEMVRRYFEK